MQYVFLIRSSAGGKKYVTRRILYAKTWDSLYCGRSPDVVRQFDSESCARILKFSQIDAIDHF